MTTASAIPPRIPPILPECCRPADVLLDDSHCRATRARAFATCHLAGASTLRPPRR